VGPHTLSRVDIGAGHIDGDRAGGCVHAIDRLDEFLGESLADQIVALLDELRRHESPLVATPHEERVLGRRLDPAVDHHEPGVLAELHAGHAGHGRLCAAHAPVREPLILRFVRHVRLKARHLDRSDLIARLEVLDGREAAVAQTDECAEEQAV